MNRVRRKNKIIAAFLLAAGVMALTACGQSENKEEDAYRQYGINCLESGKYEEAAEAFQNALDQSLGQIGEKEIDICFYKAKAQYLSGDSDAAFETYNAVIAYNEDARAYYLRGNLYFELGEQEQAVSDYKKALEEDADNYELYIGIYETFASYNLKEDGQQYLNQAMEIKGEKAKDLLYKGQISYLLEDYETAVTDLTKALEEGQTLASYYLGQTYEAQGDSETAETYIQQYLDSGEATSYDLYELGTAEMADGDYEQAIVYYTAGLDMDSVPNKQNLMKNLIAAYEYAGDFDMAGQVMDEYISLYPSDEDAQRELTFLETR